MAEQPVTVGQSNSGPRNAGQAGALTGGQTADRANPTTGSPGQAETIGPTIVKRNKALSVGPLKASATLGATLAFLGMHRSLPMLHGSQGCTAFGKIFFIQHFREPMPMQTTAMDQVSTIMGGDDAVVEGLATICKKHDPALIGLPTTGLVETQGADIKRAVRQFRSAHPECERVAVVPVASPDYSGCLETGFNAAVRALIDELVPKATAAGTRPGRRQRQVNVLVGSHLTTGDIEHLKDLLERFRLRPVVLPDIADALDGHLAESDYNALTIGGTPLDELATLGDAAATLVIGGSMAGAADLLAERTGVPDHRFPHLMGLDAMDRFIATLAEISAEPVPERIERQRSQLQDAMLDSHFALGQARIALAADADLLVGFTQLLASLGAETVAAVAPTNAPSLRAAVTSEIKIGDLEDLEQLARANGAEVLITNSHGVPTAERLGIPLLRAGFPQFDRVGGWQRQWIGYSGSRQTLFDLANILLGLHKGEIAPYRSRLKQWPEGERDGQAQDPHHGVAAA
ncbi:nitrogenase iron-molybdenum cofactor biosynthesis protein NifN [Halochromatium glycolicum]|uniref:Nitrogenase iron-molybdenum cofactor biosynthesis protein NifN n=1 Tax=Halochromatium glycolicum TaxID=85075 RepID=A0AAJ0U198_9GAMM|nr:nitrogenase iron-molybdenum cofactor biosynthesis protein NifN [Halochromatium glycolicum]MBK1703404.1 nitrogenase iron-molybdenum cofactor biosynthesis protein NifN [Halochromatium glycolicum]